MSQKLRIEIWLQALEHYNEHGSISSTIEFILSIICTIVDMVIYMRGLMTPYKDTDLS